MATMALSLLCLMQARADETTDESVEKSEMTTEVAVASPLKLQNPFDLPAPKDSTVTSAPVSSDRNVMLNAESSTSPRTINIGIPISGDLVIEENDAPVVYYFYPTIPIATWRKDESIGQTSLLTFGETAIRTGKVGLDVVSGDRHASNKFRGYASIGVDQFGTSRYNVALTGPLSKNGWGYMLDFYQNTERANGTDWEFYPWKDHTTITKVGLEKKYKNGNVRLLYKYANCRFIMTNYSPMIYEGDGKTSEFEGFRIGRDSYILGSGMIPYYDLRTGEAKTADAASSNYLESVSHTVYLTGEHRFREGMLKKWRLNYTLSFMHDETPLVVNFPLSLMAQMPDQQGSNIYKYHGTDKQYEGSIAWVMGNTVPKSNNNYFTTRAELRRKVKANDWKLGLQLQHYHRYMETQQAFYIASVESNPQLLDWYTPYEVAPGYVMNVPVSNAENGALPVRIGGGYGSVTSDYYNKAALYATDNITITPKWTVDLGVRAELQNLREDKYAMGYTADYQYQTLNEAQHFNKNFGADLNYAAMFNTLYKAGRNWGMLADATILSWKESYWDYECRDANRNPIPADDGYIRMNQGDKFRTTVSNIGAGLYFNVGSYLQIVSKVLLTQKRNIRFGDAAINNPANPTERMDCGPIYYDMKTLGWTTDIMANPFKGFTLHFLATLQSPKYKNFEYSAYGVTYSYNDKTITSLSKFLMEIDPSYTFMNGKVRAWVSLRYFGRQYGTMSNAFYYDPWWENFGGLDFNFSRNFSLKLQCTNFLNQSGVKGDIRGADQIMTDDGYRGRILMASGIRPRTFEATASFKF